jgi:prevent-host-death family protein
MIEVGMRELKTHLGAYLRRVAAGETIRVTVRRRPVADLLPAGAHPADPVRRLIAEGRVSAAPSPLPDAPPRLHRAPAPASAHVLAEREAER